MLHMLEDRCGAAGGRGRIIIQSSAGRYTRVSTTQTFSVRHGAVHIAVHAFGSGPRVVMMPSLGRGAADFDDIATRIAAAGYRVLCPEPRGLGGSRGPLHGITLHDYACDIAAIIEHDGGGPTVVAGHAFGNIVAPTTAAELPQLVGGAVLLGATAP